MLINLTFVNITGNFSLAVTGTQNGGFRDCEFKLCRYSNCYIITVNKVITKIFKLLFKFILSDDSQGLKWYRDEGDGQT
jgi:hypothetical protein